MKIIINSLLIMIYLLGFSAGQFNSGENKIEAGNLTMNINVRLSVKILKSKQYEFTGSIDNCTASKVFIAVDPSQANKTKGPYLWFEDGNDWVLMIGIMLFPPPDFMLFLNETGIKLLCLNPGETYRYTFLLETPVEFTMPPWGEGYNLNKITSERLRFAKFSIGIFCDAEDIEELISAKPAGSYFNGIEIIQSGKNIGKQLIDLQRIISSSEVSISELPNKN